MSRFKSHRGRRRGPRHLPCLLIQSVSALSGDPDFAITFSEDMIFSGTWFGTGLVVANGLGPLTIVSVTQETTN